MTLAQKKLLANLMAPLAEFEHDLLRERVKSGIAPRVVEFSEAGYSQWRIAGELGLSKTTVNEILRRHEQKVAMNSPRILDFLPEDKWKPISGFKRALGRR